MPLGPPDFYKEQSIDLALRTDVAGIDAKARHVILASGRSVPFDKLLLATRSGSRDSGRPRFRLHHRGAVRCCQIESMRS